MLGVRPGLGDPKLVLVEVYNPWGRAIYAHLDETKVPYIQYCGIMVGAKKYVIPADGFQLLPHQYYRIVDYKGDLVSVVANFGDCIGKGNKRISRPEVKLRS